MIIPKQHTEHVFKFTQDKTYTDIGLRSRVFNIGPENQGSIPGRVLPKTKKWFLMPSCLTLSIVRIKSKVEQSREWSSALSYTSV